MSKCIHINLKAYFKDYCNYTFVLFFSLCISILIFLFIHFYQNYQQYQRQELYGYYHGTFYNLDDSLVYSLQNQQMIDKISIASVEENAFYQNQLIGKIGAYSDTHLVSIHLYQGRLPQNEQEIVLEMSTLDQMKKSYTLHQTITLQVNNIEKDYLLVGIAYNFSSLQSSDGYLMVNILTIPTHIQNYDVYFMLKNDFINNIQDFSVFHQNFVVNHYTYRTEHTYQSLFVYIVLFMLLCLMSISYHLFQKRKKQLFIMHDLGGFQSQIFFMFLTEKFICFLCAFCLTLVLLLMAYFVCTYQPFSMPLKDILTIIILFILVYISSCFMDIFLFYKKQRKRQFFHRRRKKLTLSHIQYVYHRTFFFTYMIKIILVSLSLTITFIGLIDIYYQYNNYIFMKKHYPYEYSYGDLSMAYENITPISSQELEALTHIYGIKTINTIAQSPYYPINSLYDQSTYAQFLKEKVMPKYTGQTQLQGALYGISDSLFDEYQALIQKGNISFEEFKNGDVILHLPIYYDDGHDFLIENSQLGLKAIKEDQFEPGDQISILGHTLTVKAIIYDNDENCYGLIYRLYGIICNQEVYQEMTHLGNYQFISLETQNNINQEQVDAELSLVQMENVTLQNKHHERDEQFHQVLFSLGTTLFIELIVIIAFKIVFIYLNQSYQQSLHHFYCIMNDLYADEKLIKKVSIIDDLKIFIYALILSSMFIILWIYKQYLSIFQTIENITFTYIFKDVFLHIPILLYIIYFIFNLWIFHTHITQK